MSTVFLTHDVGNIIKDYNVCERFGLLTSDNKGQLTCQSIESAIDNITKNDNGPKHRHNLTRILPESVVSTLTPLKGECIATPTLPKTKLKEAWNRWKGMEEGKAVFKGDDIPPYWIITDVGNVYSGNASQFSHYDPDISNKKIFMYACAPDKGVLVLGDKCPFLLPLLTSFDRLDQKRNSHNHENKAKFNLPFEVVSNSFRCGSRFKSLSTIVESDFSSTDKKTVYVFSFGRSSGRAKGILSLIANTPYGFESTNCYDYLAEGIIGYVEATIDADSKKLFMDFIALTENNVTAGVRVIEDVFSTFSPEIYPFTSVVMGYGKGNSNTRESLFVNLFIRVLKFSNPALIKYKSAHIGSETFIVRNKGLGGNNVLVNTANNLSIYVALRNLARYIDGDTCQMRDLPIKFESNKRDEFCKIVKSLDCKDLAKTNFRLSNTSSADNYTIETNDKHSVTYIKDYCNLCTEDVIKQRKITVFNREPLPCESRFTAIMMNVNEPVSCKLLGDLAETSGILHELIIYMTPNNFTFIRIRKFLQLYMVFLYNLIKCSLIFASENHKDKLINHYKTIVVGLMLKVKEINDVNNLNTITIEQVLDKAFEVNSEEDVKLVKSQLEAFSCMLSECGADKLPCNTKVVTVSTNNW